jgi:class 3 adenylate cyclase
MVDGNSRTAGWRPRHGAWAVPVGTPITVNHLPYAFGDGGEGDLSPLHRRAGVAPRDVAVRPLPAEARLLRGRDRRLQAVSELPGGTVTFLFSDVEGSTRLLRALGDGWAGALADYRRILRDAFGEGGGREVDTQGDGMFFVFPRARPAVASAAEAQRRIEAHTWPEGATVRVRMGMHTGEPAVAEEGYVGLDVVRAARIATVAHGGQVLISATTHALVAGDPVEGVETTFLGEHQLKDLPAPVPVHQLVIAGLQTRFEVLRTETESAAEPVPIAGRELEVAREIDEVVRGLTTSIEQRVVDSLRGLDPGPRRARIEVEACAPLRRILPIAAAAVVALAAAIAVVVWLLLG